jgi:hypothetical protein
VSGHGGKLLETDRHPGELGSAATTRRNKRTTQFEVITIRASGGPKKQLGPAETAQIVAKYEAGASMVQLKVEHHMAKRTVAKALREARVAIRPSGGRPSGRR